MPCCACVDDFRGAPPAAVILLSDGVVTEGASLSDAAQNLRSAGVPLLAVGIGSAKPPRDIELADVLVDDVVFVNDVVSLQAQIKATGLEGQPAKVTLRREGESTPLAELAIVLPAAGKTLSVRLTDRPTKAGEVTYVVEITPRDDETDKKNNRQSRKVSVRDDKIRVLLAQGYPNYEFRFLKTLLERDRSVQLSTYLQDADPEYAEQDKIGAAKLSVNRDELLAYDVVIIGDVDPRLLPQSVWQNVRAFVSEKGGGAVFIAGPKFLPQLYRDNSDVSALLPVKLDSVAGGRSRQRHEPWIYSSADAARSAKPGVSIGRLAERNGADLEQAGAAVLVLSGRRIESGCAGAGRRLGKACDLLSIFRRRSRAVSCDRFDVALANRRRRAVLCPILGADDSISRARQIGQRARRRAHDRSPRIPSRRSGSAEGAVSRHAACTGGRGSRRARQCGRPGPAASHAPPQPGSRGRLRRIAGRFDRRAIRSSDG